MVRYTIYSDYHLGHPFSLKKDFTFGRNNVFLGDNFDLRNAPYHDLPTLKKNRQDTIAKCLKAGGIYLSGNHSLEPLIRKEFLSIKRGKILFLHGDIIDWGMHGANFYRTLNKAGSSKIFWKLLRYYKMVFNGNTKKIKNKWLVRAVMFAKENKCKTIVMGHFHVEKLVDVNKDGIRIIIVPRGKTIIDI